MKKLTIIDTKVVKTGTSAGGKPWTLSEVTAVSEDGAPIEEKLKTFDKLEGTVEVDVERQDDPKYGTSYLLKLPGGSVPPAGARLGPKVDELRDRVEALAARVEALERITTTLVERTNDSAGTSATPAPAPARATPYGQPPTPGAQF
jgi:hypothetical protein